MIDSENKYGIKERGFSRMRQIMHIGMGLLWMAMGVFLVFIENFSPALSVQFGDAAMKAFGVVCILYGSFRIYRGFREINSRKK